MSKRVIATWENQDPQPSGFIVRRQLTGEGTPTIIAELGANVLVHVDETVPDTEEPIRYMVSCFRDTPFGRFESPMIDDTITLIDDEPVIIGDNASVFTPYMVVNGPIDILVDGTKVNDAGLESLDDVRASVEEYGLVADAVKLYGPLIFKEVEGRVDVGFARDKGDLYAEVQNPQLFREDTLDILVERADGSFTPHHIPSVTTSDYWITLEGLSPGEEVKIYYSGLVTYYVTRAGGLLNEVDPEHPIPGHTYDELYGNAAP